MSLNRPWSRKAMMALINVYQRNPCLYDTQSPDYHNRKMNRDVPEEMVHALAQLHPDITAEDCKKKYQVPRNQYLAGCRKLADSKKSGAGTSSVYTPKLWCFEALMFLRDFVKVRAGTFVGGVVEEVADPEYQEAEEEISIEYLDEEFEYSDYSSTSTPFPAIQVESPWTSAATSKIERRTCAVSAATPLSASTGAKKQPSTLPTATAVRRSSVPSPVPGCSTERSTTPSQKKRKISDVTGSSSREETPTPTERERLDASSTIASALLKLSNKSSSKDDYDTFGNFIASRLRKLGEGYSEDVEHEIVNLIFAAERRKKYDS